MTTTAYRTEVRTTVQHLWSLLLDKVEHPDKYIEGISNVSIDRRIDKYTVIRSMQLGSIHLQEIITADPKTKTIVFKSRQHPAFTSLVINTIFEEDGKVYLDYTMNNLPKPGHPSMEWDREQIVRSAVLHMKEIAEDMAPIGG